jgi:hypothetical protein
MSEFEFHASIPRLSPRWTAATVHTMHKPKERQMKLLPLSLIVMTALSANQGALAAPPAKRSISVTHEPLVMRLNKDEFRIAFGVDGEHCGANGGTGLIQYRVDWKTPDGTTRTERKHVSFTVSPLATRTIAVDRQYFDTAEGQHMTDVVKVHIDAVTCVGSDSHVLETAKL